MSFDDSGTAKKIPTCHRISFDSIMDDSDLDQALGNANPAARKVFHDEAKAIEEIRKGIIAVTMYYPLWLCVSNIPIHKAVLPLVDTVLLCFPAAVLPVQKQLYKASNL